ncbi:hypothetical protein EBQ90_04215 [bacterium]|nr:hypothetical protein [bacterium]
MKSRLWALLYTKLQALEVYTPADFYIFIIIFNILYQSAQWTWACKLLLPEVFLKGLDSKEYALEV